MSWGIRSRLKGCGGHWARRECRLLSLVLLYDPQQRLTWIRPSGMTKALPLGRVHCVTPVKVSTTLAFSSKVRCGHTIVITPVTARRIREFPPFTINLPGKQESPDRWFPTTCSYLVRHFKETASETETYQSQDRRRIHDLSESLAMSDVV